MKQFVKRALALALVLVFALSLTACGGFDAAAYVQGNLDANLKGIASDAYLKQVNATDDSEVIATYEETVDAYVVSELSSQDLTPELVTEACYQNITDFYKELLASLKYTVGKATKTSDGFDVELTCEAVNFTSGLNPDDFTAAATDALEGYLDKETMTDDDYINLYSDVMNKYIELYHDTLAGATFAEPETMTVHLELTSDKLVFIPDEEYVAIQNALIH